MQNVDLSFSCFMGSDFRETYLFAHFPDGGDWVVGEPTSDFLGFFGFGSGNYRVKYGDPPDWAKEFQCFEFPSYDALFRERTDMPIMKAQGEIMLMYLEMLSTLLRWYKDVHHILIEIGEIRSFLRRIQSAIGSNFSDSIFESVILEFTKLLHSNSPLYRVGRGLVEYGIKPNGDGYLAFGGPKVGEDSPHPELRSFSVCDLKRYDFTHSTQLGWIDHMKGILNTLKRHHFTKTVNEQQEMLDNILSKVDALGGNYGNYG